MKKQTKKLVLSRETVRSLGETTLVDVAGASGSRCCGPAPSVDGVVCVEGILTEKDC